MYLVIFAPRIKPNRYCCFSFSWILYQFWRAQPIWMCRSYMVWCWLFY